MRRLQFGAAMLAAGLILAGCRPAERTTLPARGGQDLTGAVAIDGSSTVYPIAEAVAEEFQRAHPRVRVTAGFSGTGGGFKKFIAGETDITNASRPISQSEIEAARQNGVEFIEIPVAFDGLSLVVNPENNWVDCLTVEELRRIWQPGSQVNNWSQVRPGFPDVPIRLYGPGTDSGTFDYFTEAINDKSGASRPDFTASEDDNILVQGVAGERGGLGYFGFAYYEENRERIRLVGVDGGDGCVVPSHDAIQNGTYRPLSRPLFIYVRADAAERPEVDAFLRMMLGPDGRELIGQTGYVALPDRAYELALQRLQERRSGSVFAGGAQIGVRIEELLEREEAAR